MAHRKWLPAGILLLSASLVVVYFLAATHAASAQSEADNPETLREQAAALEAERQADTSRHSAGLVHSGVISAPLFIGVDDTTVPAYRVDPVTANAYPVFTGFNVWGAAFDIDNGRVLFNDGASLYEFVPGVGVNLLGTITAPGGGSLVVVGLAYYDGSLYATRNIANEAVYKIDTTTLSATIYIDYVDDDYDFGGFAIDPLSGTFYGTNDDTSPVGSGLFRINPDASTTLIAGYPPGENDIDGLAISGAGQAYLVTDEPGSIYVFDFGLNDYTTPVANPWTTAELFAGGAWIYDLEGPHIRLDKTVGTDPALCAAGDSIEVAPGTDVTYCYEVTNTGTVTLTQHDLVDSELGSILSGFPFSLSPGASVFLTQTAYLTQTTVNTATWTAYNSGPTDIAASSDSATVVVAPIIEVAPGSLSTTLFPGQLEVLDLVISNTGSADLNWTIQEQAASPTEDPMTFLGGFIQDGGFEAGTPNPFWNEFSSNFGTPLCSVGTCGSGGGTGPHSGTWWSWFGGTPAQESGSVDQDVNIPVGAGSLSFWLEIPAANTTGFLNVEIDGNVIDTFTEADQGAYATYTQVNLDVSAYADGGLHNLAFRSVTDAGSGALNFFVDDVALGCPAGELTWVGASPSSGTTPGGGSDLVSVSFDSTGLGQGSYDGALCIESNDPANPIVLVPLSLAVELYEIFLPIVNRE